MKSEMSPIENSFLVPFDDVMLNDFERHLKLQQINIRLTLK